MAKVKVRSCRCRPCACCRSAACCSFVWPHVASWRSGGQGPGGARCPPAPLARCKPPAAAFTVACGGETTGHLSPPTHMSKPHGTGIPLLHATLAPPLSTLQVVSPANAVERRYSVWIGGSILASLGTFQQVRRGGWCSGSASASTSAKSSSSSIGRPRQRQQQDKQQQRRGQRRRRRRGSGAERQQRGQGGASSKQREADWLLVSPRCGALLCCRTTHVAAPCAGRGSTCRCSPPTLRPLTASCDLALFCCVALQLLDVRGRVSVSCFFPVFHSSCCSLLLSFHPICCIADVDVQGGVPGIRRRAHPQEGSLSVPAPAPRRATAGRAARRRRSGSGVAGSQRAAALPSLRCCALCERQLQPDWIVQRG